MVLCQRERTMGKGTTRGRMDVTSRLILHFLEACSVLEPCLARLVLISRLVHVVIHLGCHTVFGSELALITLAPVLGTSGVGLALEIKLANDGFCRGPPTLK